MSNSSKWLIKEYIDYANGMNYGCFTNIIYFYCYRINTIIALYRVKISDNKLNLVEITLNIKHNVIINNPMILYGVVTQLQDNE